MSIFSVWMIVANGSSIAFSITAESIDISDIDSVAPRNTVIKYCS